MLCIKPGYDKLIANILINVLMLINFSGLEFSSGFISVGDKLFFPSFFRLSSCSNFQEI